MAVITYNMYFEEIWDFYLQFVDWRTTSLKKDGDKKLQINPSIDVKLKTKEAIQREASSKILKNEKMP